MTKNLIEKLSEEKWNEGKFHTQYISSEEAEFAHNKSIERIAELISLYEQAFKDKSQ